MCQKQCRDENGFKCHCMSESHQRQMQVFGQNPNRIVEGYSEEFEHSFLEHMKRSHRFSRVAATVVYNEYINDRHHVHMNSTEWATLTEFVKYLGRTGKCKVEETPKGWFITYIDRDSKTLFKERMKNKRMKADLVEEEKQEREIQKQIERAAEQLVSLTNEPQKPSEAGSEPVTELKPEADVKIGHEQSLGEERVLQAKRVVRKVIDKNDGEIEMLESKHVLRVDQAELETVIPQIGGLVRIVNGAYRGATAKLLGVDTDKFCAKVQIEKGAYVGRVLKAVEYEDSCKVAHRGLIEI
ncbi:DNA/RNA-binding protein KIN17 [Morella rubra]|uniref:DNA/RNA-binding protein KIN17 n=1 Tax=Morella rubra TaxID=262757 RepID=A0A6A1VYV0_9ROSI|nr:DNA/RNA-binding protein KIN17 [Morella rubra]